MNLRRYGTLQEFTCDRCHKPKKSKLKGSWKRYDTEWSICNGCYGELRAKGVA